MPTNVRPFASTTAKSQPVEAGIRDVDPRYLAQMVSNITNTLMEASAATLNPRTSPGLVSSLSARAVALQEQLHAATAQLDAASTPALRMAAHRALTTLGASVQDYVRAVYDAVKVADPGLTIAGLGAVAPTSSAFSDWSNNPKVLWTAGILAVVIGAGVAYWMYKKSPASKGKKAFGKLPGVIPAK